MLGQLRTSASVHNHHVPVYGGISKQHSQHLRIKLVSGQLRPGPLLLIRRAAVSGGVKRHAHTSLFCRLKQLVLSNRKATHATEPGGGQPAAYSRVCFGRKPCWRHQSKAQNSRGLQSKRQPSAEAAGNGVRGWATTDVQHGSQNQVGEGRIRSK